MNQQEIQFEQVDGVGTITLSRPEVMNAFGGTMREDLLAVMQRCADDASIRCVVVTGAGRAFCAGGDIASMADLQARNDGAPISRRMEIGSRIVHVIRTMSKPVVAAVNGAAAGAGINLALACDMRLAAESARFSESFVKIGLVPDWGGSYLLTRLVGTAKAMELMMTGDRIGADEAHRLGIVNHVIPDDAFRDATAAFARALAQGPSDALAHIKEATYLGATASLSDALKFEAKAQDELFLSANAREGMKAFLAKRQPKFS
ncbi:MAG: enoyl-CoA hydratase/isomerase family protein [Hyphomicrobiaceae bacterium]